MTSRTLLWSPFRACLVAVAVVLVASATGASRASTTATDVSTLRELVGQRVVAAIRGTAPSPPLLDRIRRGEVGGVILFGANVQSPAQLRNLTATLQRAAREAGRPPLLVATDQEGGRVRRLRWAGPERSVVELGRLTPARIRLEARQAGLALRAAGINLDLAPVADVPARGSFMAAEQRTFSTTGVIVGGAVTAFARGLADARVAAALKHFPGIGRATRNTDRSAVEITASRQALERDLAPFRAAIGVGAAPVVMVSNATYASIDSKPAAWSPPVLGLLRNELEFLGVTITDALDGAAASRRRTLPSVAALAAQAGVDLLLLTGSEASSAAAFEHVVAVAERGGISRPALQRSYGRIMELKRVYG